MAGVTVLLRMAAEQREVGVARVVEARVFPALRRMAGLAFLAATAVVRVVFGMAVITGCRRALERGVGVAGIALRFSMLADQGPPGRVVIELDVGPAGRRVAVAAALAHVLFVRIVFPVTRETGGGRIAVLVLGRVAIRALGVEVQADELEIGHAVIKVVFVETDNVGITAEVVGVTSVALRSAGIRVSAMETGAASDVIRDDFVAVHTQSALRLLVKGLVAARTLGFDIGMALDDVAGHQQRLDVLRV